VETFSEGELKGVIAHEIGHIVYKDTLAVLLNTVGKALSHGVCKCDIISGTGD
jgi:Zn-dependent protease with chaperone function